MSAIKYAIDRIFFEIPAEILHLAFMKKSGVFGIQTSLEKQITDMVLDPIVLKDANLVGGITMTIDLAQCTQSIYALSPTTRNMVVNVPYIVTNNKKILIPLTISGNYSGDSGYNTTTNSIVNSALNKMYHDAAVPETLVLNTLELIAPNTILVHDNTDNLVSGYLTVVVENNKNLNNIQPSSYMVIADAAVLATKAWIYNKLIIELDKGSLYYGHDLNRVGDIIESYSDSLEEYKTFVKEKLSKVLFMNDGVAMSRYINMLIDPNI